MKMSQQMKDILLAGAIGDAIGYKVEFKNYDEIVRTYGINGTQIENFDDNSTLIVSDDTQMTLFSLEALQKCYSPENCMLKTSDIIRKSYDNWFLTQYNPKNVSFTNSELSTFKSLHVQRAPGSTCLGALNNPKPKNNSKGCGTIMRAVPFGFIDNFEHSLTVGGEIQSKITHHHPTASISAAFFSGLIHLALYSTHNLIDATETITDHLINSYGNDARETCNAVHDAKMMYFSTNNQTNHVENIHKLGGGWTAEEALAIAIYSVLVSNNFEECVNTSINHSGDSDSTGSLAAQLWTAYKGLPNKYQSWAKRLDIVDAFEFMISDKYPSTSTI